MSEIRPGDGPNVPLCLEPLVFFHPLLTGRMGPATAPQTGGGLTLGEEPVTWPDPGVRLIDPMVTVTVAVEDEPGPSDVA